MDGRLASAGTRYTITDTSAFRDLFRGHDNYMYLPILKSIAL
jgi:hypothetical protein